MTKSQEELINLKRECEVMSNKLKELTQDELNEVMGGAANFNKSFTKSITLISAVAFGKSVNVNEVLTADQQSNHTQNNN